MHRFIDDTARHGNARMSDEDEARFLDSMRAAASRLFSCPVARMAVVGCASEVLAQLPQLIGIPGGTVVAVKTDFPAVTRPWLREQSLGRVRVRFVEDRPSESLTDALIGAIDGNTSVVAVSSVQFATGTAVDVGLLGKVVSAAGAHLIVDVTQELGARRVNVSGWDADAVVCSGYKWLGGHGGVALAAMSPRLLEQVPPMTGWMGAPDPFDFDATSLAMANDARRYTQSTMSYASVACLMAAVEELAAVGRAHRVACDGTCAPPGGGGGQARVDAFQVAIRRGRMRAHRRLVSSGSIRGGCEASARGPPDRMQRARRPRSAFPLRRTTMKATSTPSRRR